MVLQDPMTSLNPLKTIGFQICEAIELHQNLHGAQAELAAIEILEDVGIPDATNRIKQFPHEQKSLETNIIIMYFISTY